VKGATFKVQVPGKTREGKNCKEGSKGKMGKQDKKGKVCKGN